MDYRSRSVVAAATLLVFSILMPSGAAAARTQWIFSTPGNSAFCGMVINAHIGGFDGAPIHCYRRIDGLDVQMNRTGKPKVLYLQSERDQQIQAPERLRFGHYGNLWSFHCTLQTTGMTCVNPAKHGFWLGTSKGYRLF